MNWLDTNREIIKVISEVMEKNPELRFHQILIMMDLANYRDDFYTSPEEVLERIKDFV